MGTNCSSPSLRDKYSVKQLQQKICLACRRSQVQSLESPIKLSGVAESRKDLPQCLSALEAAATIWNKQYWSKWTSGLTVLKAFSETLPPIRWVSRDTGNFLQVFTEHAMKPVFCLNQLAVKHRVCSTLFFWSAFSALFRKKMCLLGSYTYPV